jgi:glutamate formiminotransferase
MAKRKKKPERQAVGKEKKPASGKKASAKKKKKKKKVGRGRDPNKPKKSGAELVEHLKKYQWKPGHSGNPSGPAVGTISLTARLRKLLAYKVEGEPGKVVADKLIEMAVKASLAGDFKFFREVFNRMDGKVVDVVHAEIRSQLEGLPNTELEEIIARAGKDDGDKD